MESGEKTKLPAASSDTSAFGLDGTPSCASSAEAFPGRWRLHSHREIAARIGTGHRGPMKAET
jgi:hypothetical protein